MKYFGGAPSICSLITGTTISHSQRNKVCDNKIAFGITILKNVPIKYYKYVGFLTTLTKSKGGEMGVGDTSDTTSRDFVSRFKHSVRREQKLPRNSKKRRKGKSRLNVATWSPLYEETPLTHGDTWPPLIRAAQTWLYCHLSAFSRAPPFLYCQTVASLSCSIMIITIFAITNHPHNHHLIIIITM